MSRPRPYYPLVSALAIGLMGLLVPVTAPCAESRPQAAAPSEPEPSVAEKVRDAHINATKLTVYLADKSTLSGHVTSIDDTSFTLALSDKAHTHRGVPYDTVVRIKYGHKSSRAEVGHDFAAAAACFFAPGVMLLGIVLRVPFY